MEISAANRLLSLARELGVQAARNRDGVPGERAAAEEIRSNDRRGDDGVRVSLSSAATKMTGTSSAEPTSDSRSTEASMPPTETVVSARSRRENAAISAYQKNAASLPGERLRIRA